MRIKQRKVSRFYQYRLSGILSVLIFLTLQFSSFSNRKSPIYSFFKENLDTVPLVKKPDSLNKPINSVNVKFNDSVNRGKTDTLNIRISSDSITAPVNYKADDSMVLDVRTKRMYLYGKGDVSYTDIKLTAPVITFDQETQIVTAKMGRDSTGNVSGMAKLVQAETTTVSDSIKFNFKTQRGITHNSYFQQEEIYNFAEKVKKMDAQTFFAYRGRFTTCNLDTPHFAFRFRKAKFINKKVAVTGSVHPEFEDVPIPIYLPFGIFPLERGRHSGILPPQLNFNQDYGMGLEGLGYYKVFNEYLDAKLWSDIYSYGSWRVNLAPSYRVRYRFSGGFTISIQDTKIAFKGDPDYSQSRSFFVTWNHNMDGKARPGVNFAANVQAGSSKYLKLIPNGGLMSAGNVLGQGQNRGGYTQPLNFTNQLSSSISFQKSWIGKPYALSVNLNHNQNTQTGIVNLSLPDLGFIVNTIYPFQPKEFVGESKWYEKLGVGYNGTFRNQVSFYDSAFRFKQIIDTFQWGANHEIPITLSLPQLGPLQLAPSVSYRERWFGQRMYRTWNRDTKKLDTSIQKGLYSAREMSVAFSLGTAFFGTFNAKNKDAKIQAIRHVMRPTAGFSYKPDMNSQYYYRAQIDTSGNKYLFSVFDGSLYQAYSPGRTGGLNFGIDNNLEMKVKSKKDTGEAAIKKVRVLEGFGIQSSYNFLADSFKLSTFNIYARSVLFEKLNITAYAIMDPYAFDSRGYRLKKYAWQNGGKFTPGTITSGSLNISTNFQSKKKNDKKEEELDKSSDDYMYQDQLMQQLDYIRRNPAEFADFNVTWSLNLGFSLQFARQPKPDYSGFKTEFTSSLNFNGDFNLTKKWKLGANGFYDVRNLNLQSLTMFLSRDLHCWQMSINVTPIGLYRFFSININPKSGMLRDLKINRTRYFYNR